MRNKIYLRRWFLENAAGCTTFFLNYIDRKKIPEKKLWLTSFFFPKPGLGKIPCQAKLGEHVCSQVQLGNERKWWAVPTLRPHRLEAGATGPPMLEACATQNQSTAGGTPALPEPQQKIKGRLSACPRLADLPVDYHSLKPAAGPLTDRRPGVPGCLPGSRKKP